MTATITGAVQVLAHVPELVLSGSKPAREIARHAAVADVIAGRLRSYTDAATYLPNQVFIGAEPPRPLTVSDRPWWSAPRPLVDESATGMLFNQDELLAAMAYVDSAGLLSLADPHGELDRGRRQAAVVGALNVERQAVSTDADAAQIVPGVASPLARVHWGYPGDAALAPHVVLENLATKASAALALRVLLETTSTDPTTLDLVISCSEEAVGDRYQRGGGNLGKAVAEAVGASRASGFDVKNFCAAPIPGLVVASSLVDSGVAERVAVVAGGSLPKLGMKFQGHVKHDMPVLEDCLGAVAVLVERSSEGCTVRLDAVGRHSVAAGGSNAAIFSELLLDPLEGAGLKVEDVDLFGTELHNPELTEPQGSGDVPLRNYRMIAALAARRQHIAASDVDDFLAQHCVSGFAPTQGHIASAICLLPHVLAEMRAGRVRRAQLVAKGSLFLGKMSALSDGMSVVLES